MRLLREEVTAYLLALFFFLSAFFLKDISLKALLLHSSLIFFSIGYYKRRLYYLLIPKDLWKGIKEGILCLLSLFAISLFSLFLSLLFFPDLPRVAKTIERFSLLTIITAIFIAPFSEELFFRAFLVDRVGVLWASVLFALTHFTYGSLAEIVGTFFLGMVLGHFYKRNNHLFQNVIGHAFFNTFSILLVKTLHGF